MPNLSQDSHIAYNTVLNLGNTIEWDWPAEKLKNGF